MIRLEINGSYENVSEDIYDFSFLIEKYMSLEAKNYFESALDNIFSYIDDLEIENEDLLKQLQSYGDE